MNRHTHCRSKTSNGWSCLGGLTLVALALSASAANYNVDVSGHPLYTDPNYPDRQIQLGGFSGLFPVPGDKTHTMFYTVTDRGPTQDFNTPDGKTHKVLLCYDMAPMIVKLQLQPDGTAQVLETIPLRKQVAPDLFEPISGGVNGIELSPEKLETLDFRKLAPDPDALDPEGITIDAKGYFWICEEYRPSIAMVGPDGTVMLRIVPKGTLAKTEPKEKVPTLGILPAVLTKRVNNRGMEGIAFGRNGFIYAIVQRPLANPDKPTSEASSNLRIVEIDINALFGPNPQAAVRQFIYRAESANAKVYASDLFALTPSIFCVPERATDKLFAINMSMATDITPFESEDGTLLTDPTLTIEQLDELGLAQLGIKPVKKTVLLPTLTGLHKELAKCEGLCVVGGPGGRNIVMTYDNDFNLADLGDGTTTPGSIILKSPDVFPALITAPLPEEIEFE